MLHGKLSPFLCFEPTTWWCGLMLFRPLITNKSIFISYSFLTPFFILNLYHIIPLTWLYSRLKSCRWAGCSLYWRHVIPLGTLLLSSSTVYFWRSGERPNLQAVFKSQGHFGFIQTFSVSFSAVSRLVISSILTATDYWLSVLIDLSLLILKSLSWEVIVCSDPIVVNMKLRFLFVRCITLHFFSLNFICHFYCPFTQ